MSAARWDTPTRRAYLRGDLDARPLATLTPVSAHPAIPPGEHAAIVASLRAWLPYIRTGEIPPSGPYFFLATGARRYPVSDAWAARLLVTLYRSNPELFAACDHCGAVPPCPDRMSSCCGNCGAWDGAS